MRKTPYADNWPIDDRPTLRKRGTSPEMLGRCTIFHLFVIDLGYLVDNRKSEVALRTLIERRGNGSIANHLFHGKATDVRLGHLEGGQSESDILLTRSRKALDLGGKQLWDPSIVRSEAPYVFGSPMDSDLAITCESRDGQQICFNNRSVEFRIFPRGILSVSSRSEFTPASGPPLTLTSFIEAVKHLKIEVNARVLGELERFIAVAAESKQQLAGTDVVWRTRDANTRDYLRQHVVNHTLMFIESVPGLEAPTEPDSPVLDVSDPGVQASLSGLLNQTEWFEIYAQEYGERVFADVLRNRNDEVYLTDNDSSIVVLANYWRMGDPLQLYQEDLVLAVQLELSKLAYLRFLTFLLREDPSAQIALSSDHKVDRSSALEFVLGTQSALLRSSYDRPPKTLIEHGFTRRFLAQLSSRRGTAELATQLDREVLRILRAVEFRASLSVAEQALILSRSW